jgi:DNA-directed RNA polymerase specialized sigma54-like protein
MSAKHSDKELAAIIRNALVPKGFRPTSLADVEAMLDAIGGEEPSPEKLARMLRKVKGEEPIGILQRGHEEVIEALTPREMDLVAFYRSRGEAIPPEIQAKLDAMRRRAAAEDEAEDAE